jgi:hypothetical protein
MSKDYERAREPAALSGPRLRALRCSSSLCGRGFAFVTDGMKVGKLAGGADVR